MEQKTLRLQNFAAIQKDGNGVLGKVLYYSLSNILIDKEKFSELCQSIGFPYQPTRRTALADAFRSATGDIYERMWCFRRFRPAPVMTPGTTSAIAQRQGGGQRQPPGRGQKKTCKNGKLLA